MAPTIYHAKNLRFIKFHYLIIKTITLSSYWCIKLNHNWRPYRIIKLFFLIYHNPGQTCWDKSWKSIKIQEMDQFFKFQILPLTPYFNVESDQVLLLKAWNFANSIDLWLRGGFSLENRFSILSQVLSKIVGEEVTEIFIT